MRKPKQFKHLPLLFILAVLIPSVFLSIIAIRAANQEEASIRRGIQRSLEAELTNVVTMMRTELSRMQEELESSCPRDVLPVPGDSFRLWKEQNPLVGVPFLLSADYEILWPRMDAFPSAEDMAFLNWNRDFVTDRTVIPYYQNVAMLYTERIKEKDMPDAGAGQVSREEAVEGERKLESGKTEMAPPRTADSVKETKASDALARPKTEELQVQQKTLAQFEKDPRFRRKVFDAAEEQGKVAEQRNVAPKTADALDGEAAGLPMKSIYISEPRKFSQIVEDRESGMIPRFIEESLTLMFWRRSEGGRIVGCLVGEDEFKSRLLALLPESYSATRILTLLDENGRPLLTPDTDAGGARDWRRPFSAREISEVLPRWEAAAYLTDPDVITSRAGTTRMIILALIALFSISILWGGFYILGSLRRQMALARQKTSFVANVSHELKTPLTSIRMFAEMLKERRQPDRERRERYLDLMVSETDRLTRLINNVLDFSKMDRGKREYLKKRLDLALLVEEMVNGQRIRLEQKGFSVTLDRPDRPIPVAADEEALKQALLNLLSNAEKYSGGRKEITVEVTLETENALILVKDRGIGIPPEEAKKIFREFYRVDDSLTADVRGSGLGLTIARRIIRDHGGEIRHVPREGGGSIFQISIPLEDVPA
jgi:signal transduction histidine kinase